MTNIVLIKQKPRSSMSERGLLFLAALLCYNDLLYASLRAVDEAYVIHTCMKVQFLCLQDHAVASFAESLLPDRMNTHAQAIGDLKVNFLRFFCQGKLKVPYIGRCIRINTEVVVVDFCRGIDTYGIDHRIGDIDHQRIGIVIIL